MKCLMGLLVLWTLGSQALAGPTEFDYGVHLFETGDYYRSITELERVRFFSPQSKESEGALWLIADAYLKGEKWDLAAQSYNDFLETYPTSPHAVEAGFFRAEAIYEARKLEEAKEAYIGLLKNPALGDLAAVAHLRLASLSLVNEEWQDAALQFSEAGKLEQGRLGELEDWEKLCRQGQALQANSMSLALLSSALIPGSGEMESGYVSDGVSSFILVGGLLAWSAYFYATHQQLSGTVFGVVGGVFYLGNLQGTVLAVQRANRDRPRALIKKILDDLAQQAVPDPNLEPWIKEAP